MRTNLKKAVCVLFAVLLLACSFPLPVFAVDPVSASVIANSFAQAITAYGAANGVSLGFDVANTDGIGESVHELWTAFRNGTQTADDYDTLAEALFPDLYYKAERALAGAQTASYVGMRITSEYAEVFDNFYNWLLSGPAEMVQVDNQYYHFQVDSSTGTVLPISVYSLPSLNGFEVAVLPMRSVGTSSSYREYEVANSNYPAFAYNARYVSSSGTPGDTYTIFISKGSPVVKSRTVYPANPGQNTSWGNHNSSLDSASGYYYNSGLIVRDDLPTYDYTGGSSNRLPSVLFSATSSSSVVEQPVISVLPYDSTNTADFPDTADPNYDALHRAKDVPLDVPWDDTLYGDGSLTDAEREAIAGTIDGVLVQDGVLDLVETGTADPEPPGPDEDPSDEPGAYAVLGLDDVFPFCIPFDIYNFLSALAATPTPPHFTATLAFPAAVGGNQTIDIDFDNPTFNQLAQLLRLLELLAFIVGLALLTRSMFIRG